jgi:NAD(P)-dependent dehydrogenase (short-subunit alcohol dehydrogenase family)
MARIAPNEKIILACRNQKTGQEVAQAIQQKTGHKNVITMPLDLESLQSVRAFAARFSKQSGQEIVALVNNAGIQHVSETRRTHDGYEVTFGVNHLASFYLTVLLLPAMAAGGSITFTASGVHDPQQKTGVEHPVFKDARALAYPEETAEKRSVVGLRRYSTSKLCNILTTYELQRRLAGTTIRVNAFDPGLVPGTGLARSYSPFLRFVWGNVFPLLRYFMRNVNTAQDSGQRLANLAYSAEYHSSNGKYFEGTREIKSSADSYNREFQQILWSSTVALLDIKQQETSVLLT